MENETTKECNIKGKIKLCIEYKVIVLIGVYYLKASKNIISLTKFMAKGYQVIGEGREWAGGGVGREGGSYESIEKREERRGARDVIRES